MKQIKINILAQNRTDACSFYRSWGPWCDVRRAAGIPVHLEERARIDWSAAMEFDLIFLQRPFLKQHLEVIEIAHDVGTPVWVDWDDALWAVERDNPFFGNYGPQLKDVCFRIARAADVVTVTTEYLKRMLPEDVRGKVRVIPNELPKRLRNKNHAHDHTLDLALKKESRSKMKSMSKGKVVICWRGSRTHERDWMEHMGAVMDLNHSKAVEFVLVGDPPFWVQQQIGSRYKTTVVQEMPIGKYFNWMCGNGPQADIIFVPLAFTPFNMAKSNIAAIEGAAGGMLPVTPGWDQWATGTAADQFQYNDHAAPALKRAVEAVKAGRAEGIAAEMAAHFNETATGVDARLGVLDELGL